MDLLHSEIKRTFLKFLVPSIGGALVVTLYSFVDTIAIGQGVGPDGTAACAVLLPVSFRLKKYLLSEKGNAGWGDF